MGGVMERTRRVGAGVRRGGGERMRGYAAVGTASKGNPPSGAVCRVGVYADDCAFNVTVASASGRCCGSCTIPRTVPKIVASAGTLRKSKAASNFKTPRINVLQSSKARRKVAARADQIGGKKWLLVSAKQARRGRQ